MCFAALGTVCGVWWHSGVCELAYRGKRNTCMRGIRGSQPANLTPWYTMNFHSKGEFVLTRQICTTTGTARGLTAGTVCLNHLRTRSFASARQCTFASSARESWQRQTGRQGLEKGAKDPYYCVMQLFCVCIPSVWHVFNRCAAAE
jgi:hypothetical protein